MRTSKYLTSVAAGALALVAATLAASPASASLTVFQTYVGNYGLSTDGGGSTSNAYNVSAFVPLGATVTAAYLYQSNFDSTNTVHAVSLNGNPLVFGGAVNNTDTCCNLSSARADVTSLVAPIINGGAGGTYNFAITEGSSLTDGVGLAVVYSLASLPVSTVALLDGFSADQGDTFSVNFATPLDPTAPGFVADMRLGIGFSCCGQDSNVTVNGTLITAVAGNNDDGAQVANGSLITFGGDDDAFSGLLPAYGDDHERYDLTPYITKGSTTIKIDTNNPSNDDNIFFAGFRISGRGGVNEPPPPPVGGVPEPATWAMMLMGFFGLGAVLRRRQGVAFAA